MRTTTNEENGEFRLDRTHFSAARLTDPDDAVASWLSRPPVERLQSAEQSMAIPALPRDFREFLKSLNANRVDNRPFGSAASGLTPDLFLAQNNTVRLGRPPTIPPSSSQFQIDDIIRLQQNKAASARAKDLADLERLPPCPSDFIH
jgi:hypothetical protein